MRKIKVDSLTKKYGNRTILDDINFEINEGEYVQIQGQSGAGKTTLLNILGLIDSDYSGQITLLDNSCLKNDRVSSRLRNEQIGFIYQAYNLIHDMTVMENICVPALYNNTSNFFERCLELMNELKIYQLKDEPIQNLSGGEKQRTAIARAMILNPSIILADEPVGNLDGDNSRIVLDYIDKLNKSGKTIILVTHNAPQMIKSDRLLIIKDRKLYEG